MSCGLSSRQKELYHRLKERISIDDLLKSSLSHSNTASKDSTSTLMNIVMQFRKVRERGREGRREGGREGGREGRREGGRELSYSYFHCRCVIILSYLREEMFSLQSAYPFLPFPCHAYFTITVSAHLTSLVKGIRNYFKFLF